MIQSEPRVVVISETEQEFLGDRYFIDKKHKYFFSPKKGFLHKAVWRYFRGKRKADMEIHHKDHNRHNNQIENLEMLTREEHQLRHGIKAGPKVTMNTSINLIKWRAGLL